MTAYEAGRAETAHRLAKKLVAAYPQFGGAYYLLGLLALDKDQPQPALHHLTKAAALTPDQPAPRLMMATALQMLGRLDEAVQHMLNVLEHHPDHPEAHARLGAYLLDLGQDGDAVRHLQAALAVHSDWSAVLNNLGLAQGHLGNVEAAVDAAREAVRISPDHVGFRVNLAMALDNAGLPEQALEHAEQSVADDPHNDDAWLALGMIHKKAGRLPLAADAFAHAPSVASARWSLAEILRGLGHAELAAKHYRACLDLDPDDHHGARLGLALVTGQAGPARAPQAYVRQLFDDFAPDFDRCLVEGLDYRAPALLGRALDAVLAGRTDLDVVDLGCGTGLAAEVLKPFARRLDGIDLSPAMIDKAKQKALYDHLTVGDVLSVTGTYDVAVAADVLVYLGDLDMVMQSVARALRPGGLFAFTVEYLSGEYLSGEHLSGEHLSGTQDWRLGEKSRYAHSEPYVRQAAQAAGFTVRVMEHVSTRKDAGLPVPGLLAVVQHG